MSMYLSGLLNPIVFWLCSDGADTLIATSLLDGLDVDIF